MENETPTDSTTQSHGQLFPSEHTFELSIEQFNSIPARRFRYTVLYIVAFMIWLSIFTFFWAAIESPDQAAPAADLPETTQLPTSIVALYVLTGICLVLFYVQFVNVLRLMGYHVMMIVCLCLAVMLPIPGLLVVVFVDRLLVAKAWNAAKERLDEQQEAQTENHV